MVRSGHQARTCLTSRTAWTGSSMVRISALAWPRLSRSSSSGPRGVAEDQVVARRAGPGRPRRYRNRPRHRACRAASSISRDQPADPAEADDHRAAARRGWARCRPASAWLRPRAARDIAAELRQQRRQGQAHRGDDRPEAARVSALISRAQRRRREHDQGGFGRARPSAGRSRPRPPAAAAQPQQQRR